MEEKHYVCKQPTGCVGNGRLTVEERSAPGICRICKVPLCDECVLFADNIPAMAQWPEEQRKNIIPKPTGVISGILCGGCIREDWL